MSSRLLLSFRYTQLFDTCGSGSKASLVLPHYVWLESNPSLQLIWPELLHEYPKRTAWSAHVCSLQISKRGSFFRISRNPWFLWFCLKLSENSAMSVWDQNHFSQYVYWQSLCLSIKIYLWAHHVFSDPKKEGDFPHVFAASSFIYVHNLKLFGSGLNIEEIDYMFVWDQNHFVRCLCSQDLARHKKRQSTVLFLLSIKVTNT